MTAFRLFSKKHFLNSSYVLLRRLIVVLSKFVLSILLARLTTKEVLGQYSFIMSIIYLLTILSLPGLGVAIVRSVARGYEGSYRLAVRESLKWSFLGITALVLFGAYLISVRGDVTVGSTLIVSSPFFPLVVGLGWWQSFLDGKERFATSAWYCWFQNLLRTGIFIVVLLFYKNNVRLLILAHLITLGVSNLFFLSKTLTSTDNQLVDTGTLSYGKYLTAINSMGIVLKYIDKLVVGLISFEILALFTIALNLFEEIKGFIRAGFSVFLPSFAKVSLRYSPSVVPLLLIVGLFLSVVSYSFSAFFFKTVFGSQYVGSIAIFNYLIILFPFVTTNAFLSNKVFAEQETVMIKRLNLFTPAISLVGSVGAYFFTRSLLVFVVTKFYMLYVINFIFLTVWYRRQKKGVCKCYL